jgi:16S rRNA (adenine1518-N6/adenine1519-N6)-dimethyltransferase
MGEKNKSSSVKATLSELNVSPKKSRGQNFLHQKDLAAAIVHDSGLTPGDTVLEIGPGLGVLTEQIFSICKNLTTIEIEENLARELPERVRGLSPSQVINSDIRKFSLDRLGPVEGLSVLGNVPYSISSDIIIWLLDNSNLIRRATLLLQREFAERIAGTPGTKAYGILSVQTALYADARVGRVVPGTVFHPPTKVESRVLHLEFLNAPRHEIVNHDFFRKTVRGLFSMRRKTAINNLVHLGFCANKIDAANLLESLGLNPKARAETFTVETFALLSNHLYRQHLNSPPN